MVQWQEALYQRVGQWALVWGGGWSGLSLD